MVLNKIFGKKNSGADINSLKERFSQVSTIPDSQQVPAQTVQVQDAINDTSSVQQPSVQQVPVSQPIQSQQVPVQSSPSVFGQQPIGVAPPVSQPIQSQQPLVSPVVQQPSVQQVPVSQPIQSQQPSVADLPSWAVESAGEEIANEISSQPTVQSSPANAATETLEQIEDKFYDAKLNSLIIDQVKELIEIDNNLNTKIEDNSSEIKKEILEREQLVKKVDQHFDKVKELERNMEKFLGLYEMVTNQFNPFVDKDSSNLFLDEKDTKYDNTVVEKPSGESSPIPEDFAREVSSPSSVQQQQQQQPISQQVVQPAPIQQVPAQQIPIPPQASASWNYCPIHHNIHPSLHFELKDGQKLSSIYDVLAVLEQMDDELFSHHVSLKHNDFSNWIYKVLGLTDLGQQLDLIKTKPEMIQSIRSYIQTKMNTTV